MYHELNVLFYLVVLLMLGALCGIVWVFTALVKNLIQINLDLEAE